MKSMKAVTLAGLMAVAAGGVMAQGASAGAAGPGGSGISGKVVGTTPAVRPAVTATGIAPADGSHNLMQPGVQPFGTYRSLDEVRTSRTWINDGYAVPYRAETRMMGNTRARITDYWVDVPAGVRDEDDFRRWLSLS